jgi:hypothetical protein
MALLPHGPLEQIAENLWMVRGEIKSAPIGRRMVIVRDTASNLFVHNAIMLDEAGFRAFDALGKVRAIFIVNRFHDMDGGRMKERYPAAKLVALPAVRDKLLGKFPTLEAFDPSLLPPNVTIRTIPGLKGDESVMEVSTASGVTQVYADAFFNLPHGSGFAGFMLKVLGSSGGFRLTTIGKLAMLKDRAAFRAFVEAQAARTDIERIIVAHGDVVTGDASAALAQARALL